MKNQLLTKVVIGSSVALAALSGALHANESPFAASSLESGYQLAQADTKSKEGKCGEGKCGAKNEESGKKADGKCGEGKCGAKGGDEESDTDSDKKTDGKCGEGKCGGKA